MDPVMCLEQLSKKINGLNRMFLADIHPDEKERIGEEIRKLEHEKWLINTELNKVKLLEIKYQHIDGINNPNNYELFESTIRCKICKSIGDDEYLCHNSTCKWREITSVKYQFSIMS
jgi:hypothetical protein